MRRRRGICHVNDKRKLNRSEFMRQKCENGFHDDVSGSDKWVQFIYVRVKYLWIHQRSSVNIIGKNLSAHLLLYSNFTHWELPAIERSRLLDSLLVNHISSELSHDSSVQLRFKEVRSSFVHFNLEKNRNMEQLHSELLNDDFAINFEFFLW